MIVAICSCSCDRQRSFCRRTPANDDFRPDSNGVLDYLVHSLYLSVINERSHLAARIGRRTNADLLQSFRQRGSEPIRNSSLDYSAAAGHAELAREDGKRRRDLRHSSVEVGVIKNDHRRLAAELQTELFKTVFDKRYWAGDTFADQLTFALRHEHIDLLILKRIFDAAPEAEVEAFVRAAPTGIRNRRAWYFYETLSGRTLSLDDAPKAEAIDVLDPAAYFTGKPRLSRRHPVRDNLLGTGRFCPVIRRTKVLMDFLARDLSTKARETIGRTGAHLVARAASFLLLADSRASFQIEGERPPRNRLERWGRAVLQAGKSRLTLDEIIRLQGVLIEDSRFTKAGLRPDGVFLGERDHLNEPLPEFIGARAEDLGDLMAGLLEANARMREDEIEPVLKVTATAFGFVYIHPVPGREWPCAQVPHPSRARRAPVHAARHGVPGLIGHARPH